MEDDSIVAEQPQRGQQGPVRARKLYCDCEAGTVSVQAQVVTCRGVPFSHTGPKSYHAKCVGYDWWDETKTWLCDECEAVQSMTQASAAAPSRTTSQRSDGSEEEIRAITDKSYYHDGRVMYKVSWKRSANQPRLPDEWCFATVINAPDLIAKFERGEKAVDSDDEGDDEPLDPPNEADLKAMHPYRAQFGRGYWAIVREVWPLVAKHSAIPDDLQDSDDLKAICVSILASIPWDLLSSICGASVRRRKIADSGLKALLEANFNSSIARPCIYLYEFCDRDGLSLIVAEMRLIIVSARKYAHPTCDADKEYAVAIDSVAAVGGRLTAGERNNVLAGHRRYLPNDTERRKLDEMLIALEALIADMPDEDRVPFVLREVGYTNDGPRRMDKEHGRHSSSNKMMNLFEAISYESLGATYENRGEVIFLCFERTHATVGEILFSILAPCYHHTGRGFNGVEAGNSVRSVDKVTDLRKWDAWLDAASAPIEANIACEKQRIAVYRAKQQQLEGQIKVAAQDLQAAMGEQLQATKQLVEKQEDIVEMFSELNSS